MNNAQLGEQVGYGYILRKAWPIILANSSVPLLGLVDTAVIGRTGSVAELGAIALGAIVFSFVYWGFGFLRMGTTGFVAQADGAGDEGEVRAALFRALLCALACGFVILLLQIPIGFSALSLLNASEQVEEVTATYISLRIWGAPAALGLFALMGLLVGLNMSKTLLMVQLILNGSNVVLDIWFAGVLDWGAQGIAVGTALAEWGSFFLALVIVLRVLRRRHQTCVSESSIPKVERFVNWPVIISADKLRHMLAVNSDIMIRTLFLVFGFAWFTNYGAKFGDVHLAANHILLQFVSFSAFFLDGFAYVAESMVGRAKGARNRQMFQVSVAESTRLAAVSSLLLAVVVLVGGPYFIAMLTDLEAVRAAALYVLPIASFYVLLSFAAFQLDGIYIGVTRTKAMRNASILSLLCFLAFSQVLTRYFDNIGLWIAFVLYVCARALFLLMYYRSLVEDEFPDSIN